MTSDIKKRMLLTKTFVLFSTLLKSIWSRELMGRPNNAPSIYFQSIFPSEDSRKGVWNVDNNLLFVDVLYLFCHSVQYEALLSGDGLTLHVELPRTNLQQAAL